MPDPRPFRCLVIGDLHGCWDEADADFVESSGYDLVVFVGDLGDENPELVRSIAELDADKVVMLGNHDAWQSFTNKEPTQALRDSLDALGDDHLAYAIRELPEAGVTMIGARPFSWGGADLRSPEVYGEFYGVRSIEESADRIVELAERARHDQIVVLAHNGPRGLGSGTTDIYGKDFGRRPGGDWGDRDLQLALAEIARGGRRVVAVLAGHMHHRVSTPRGAERTRFVRHGRTVHINSAVVPRGRRLEDGEEVRYFVEVDLLAGRVERIDEIWVDGDGRVRDRVEPRFAALTRG